MLTIKALLRGTCMYLDKRTNRQEASPTVIHHLHRPEMETVRTSSFRISACKTIGPKSHLGLQIMEMLRPPTIPTSLGFRR